MNFFIVLVFENAAIHYRFLQALRANVIALAAIAAIAYDYVHKLHCSVDVVGELCCILRCTLMMARRLVMLQQAGYNPTLCASRLLVTWCQS